MVAGSRTRELLLGLSTALSLAGAVSCPPNPALSCSSEISRSADPCCVPHPAGLFIFRQRFEPDVESDGGRWGIDGLDVLESVELKMLCVRSQDWYRRAWKVGADGSASCATQKLLTSSPASSRHDHEEIGSLCLRSTLFQGEEEFQRAEYEWAQSEVGEGMEEVWERAVRGFCCLIVILIPSVEHCRSLRLDIGR